MWLAAGQKALPRLCLAQYLGMIVALISGRVGTQEVKVALVVNVPYIYALSLVENHRNWCIVMSSILVLSSNELQ